MNLNLRVCKHCGQTIRATPVPAIYPPQEPVWYIGTELPTTPEAYTDATVCLGRVSGEFTVTSNPNFSHEPAEQAPAPTCGPEGCR